MRYLSIIILCLAAVSASAGEVNDYDRFELWNECKPMTLIVEDVYEDATAIGLTKESIEAGVRDEQGFARRGCYTFRRRAMVDI